MTDYDIKWFNKNATSYKQTTRPETNITHEQALLAKGRTDTLGNVNLVDLGENILAIQFDEVLS